MCGCRRAFLSERAPSSHSVFSADLFLERRVLNSFYTCSRLRGRGRTFSKAGRKGQTVILLLRRIWKSGLIPLALPHIEMLISSLSPPAFRE